MEERIGERLVDAAAGVALARGGHHQDLLTGLLFGGALARELVGERRDALADVDDLDASDGRGLGDLRREDAARIGMVGIGIGVGPAGGPRSGGSWTAGSEGSSVSLASAIGAGERAC